QKRDRSLQLFLLVSFESRRHTCGSGTGERFVHGGIQLGSIIAIVANEVSHGLTGAVKNDGLRYRVLLGSEICREHVVCCQSDRIGYTELLNESLDVGRRGTAAVVYVKADHFESAVAVFVFYANKLRSALTTRTAPRCPEVEDHHLTAIVRQLDGTAVNRLDVEVRRSC